MTSPGLSKPRKARVGSFLRSLRRVVAHWRAIVLLLILPCVVFLEARFDEFARFDLILLALLLIFMASQIFWLGRLVDVGERFIPGRPRRFWLVIMTVAVYLFVCLYSYPEAGLGHASLMITAISTNVLSGVAFVMSVVIISRTFISASFRCFSRVYFAVYSMFLLLWLTS